MTMKRTLILLSVLALFLPDIDAQSGFDELAKTPPMGWNSWNTFRLEINEDLVMGIADVFIEKGLKDAGLNLGDTESPVTPVFLKGGVPEATQVTRDLRENYSLFCSIVIYPVVPRDVIMLRLIPTAMHSLEDVEYTVKAFKEIKKKLDNNEYAKEMADFN